MRPPLFICLSLIWLLTAAADAPGHGGPIRGLATAGGQAVSASFDGSAILWPQGLTLRAHDGAVNAAAFLPEGRIATGGADGQILIWQSDTLQATWPGHTAPISALATQADRLASASWDGTVRIWSPDGQSQTLQGHQGQVTAVAFSPDNHVVSAGYDGTIRIWAKNGTAQTLTLGLPQNALAIAPNGEILTAGADGTLRLIQPNGLTRQLTLDTTPLTALSLSPDGTRIAVAGLSGLAAVIDRASLHVTTVFLGTERPLWAIAWDRDTVLTGGAGRVLRRWDSTTGRLIETLGTPPPEEPLPTADRGAQIFRACSACHSLTAEGGNRAGPSLHALFGRQIATQPLYAYSAALRAMDLVWTPETVADLFDRGPHAATPGTKMPEQRIADPADRAALIGFLQSATR